MGHFKGKIGNAHPRCHVTPIRDLENFRPKTALLHT